MKLEIETPPAPEGYEIVDCRPPENLENMLNGAGEVVVYCEGEGCGHHWPAYIVRRIRTDTERLEFVFQRDVVFDARYQTAVSVRTTRGALVRGCAKDYRAAIDEAMEQSHDTDTQ